MIAVCQEGRGYQWKEIREYVCGDGLANVDGKGVGDSRAWPFAAAMWRTELPLSSMMALSTSGENVAIKC